MKLLFIILSVFLLSACANIDKSGVYKGDKALYAADDTVMKTIEGIDAFLKWETANHAEIRLKNPEIAHFANDLRDSVPRWYQSIKALRAVYLSNPTPENAASIQNVVNLLNAALAEAAKYLAKPL